MNSKNKLFAAALGLLSAFPCPSHSYDQVQFEKIISLATRKAEPSVMRLDKEGGFWILDSATLNIQRISRTGKPDITIASGKKKTDVFKKPVDFCFTNTGEMLVVADPGLRRVAFLGANSETAETSSNQKTASRWKNLSVIQQIDLENPAALAVSADDIVAVGDMKEKVIHIYSLDGVLLHKLLPIPEKAFESINAMAYSKDGILWVVDGSRGLLHRFGPDRKWLGVTDGMRDAQGLALDEYGFAYVSLAEGRWREIDRDGKVTGTFGTKGKNPGQLSRPFGMALQDATLLWVAESGNTRLQPFRITNQEKTTPLVSQPSARLQVRKHSEWSGIFSGGVMLANGETVLKNKKGLFEWFDKEGKSRLVLTKRGKKEQSIGRAEGVSKDDAGNLWVADSSDHKLKKVSPDGEVVKSLGAKGKQEGSLKGPHHLQVRYDGSLVVSDKNDGRVQVLSDQGLFLFSVGKIGKGRGEFQTVTALAANRNLIAILDNERKALIFYDNNGKFVHEMANQENAAPVWRDLKDIAVDGDGRFHILDQGSNRVRIFDNQAKFIADLSMGGGFLATGPDNRLMVFSPTGIKVFSVYVVPKGIENLTAIDDSGAIEVKWNANVDATSYRVYRSSGSNSFALFSASAALSAVDEDLTPNVVYRYAVSGVNSLGYEGNWTVSTPIKASKRKDVPLVSITSSEFKPVFTAAFKHYASKPIGTIRVKNNDEKPNRDVKVAMSLKNYTDFPTETVIASLAPGEEVTVPVTMTFNDRVLELTENTPVQLDVKLHYFQDNAEKIVSQNAPLTLYSRNAISWDDKARISSFITPRDVPVMEFSRAAIKSFLTPVKVATIGKPLAKVTLLYEAVNALGMSYVPDPKTPYAEVAGKPDVLDYVQYPRETLRTKMGDCDDTTALMASLLESIGVETALVETPSHILMMANLEENDPEILGFPSERFVDFRGSLWVPVETTSLGKNFIEAWQAGISAIKTAQSTNQAGFFSVIDASQKYPPVTLVETVNQQPEFPEEKLKETFPAILARLEKERYQYRLDMVKALASKDPSDPTLQIRLGMVHVEGGKVSEGRTIFTALLGDESVEVQASAHNNLGNLDYLVGNYTEAAEHYDLAAVLAPEDGGIAINRARSAWKLQNQDSAKKYLVEARALLPDWREYTADLPPELLPAEAKSTGEK